MEGVEDPPYELVVISRNDSGGVPRIAVLKKMFKGNLDRLFRDPEFINAGLETKLDCCAQILKGGAALEALKILHLDQKPQNTFYDLVEANGKKRYLMKIADFGGAKKADSSRRPITTPRYLPVDEKDRETSKTDVYQRGILIYEILTNGKRPYGEIIVNDETKRGYPGYPDLTKDFDSHTLETLKVPIPLINLIKKMCHPNPFNRPSSQEAKIEWESNAAVVSPDYIPRRVERVA